MWLDGEGHCRMAIRSCAVVITISVDDVIGMTRDTGNQASISVIYSDLVSHTHTLKHWQWCITGPMYHVLTSCAAQVSCFAGCTCVNTLFPGETKIVWWKSNVLYTWA